MLIDRGKGPPLVLVPGVQGRWEWMQPTVDALAEHFRVLTFSLAGDLASGQSLEPRLGFDTFIAQVDRAFEEAGLTSALLCGVSYGGLIAYRYASLRPARIRQLVLVSALPPDYRPDRRYHFYARAPRLLFPLFLAASAHRASPELRAAMPRWTHRTRDIVVHGWRVLRAPVSPALMRDRMRLLVDAELFSPAGQVTAPTLVVTGEADLDRTVPVEVTERYLHFVPGAERATLERTGHMGTITRPHAFASIVRDFASRHESEGRSPQEAMAV